MEKVLVKKILPPLSYKIPFSIQTIIYHGELKKRKKILIHLNQTRRRNRGGLFVSENLPRKFKVLGLN